MSFHAHNPAAVSHLFSRVRVLANGSLPTRNDIGGLCSSCGPLPARVELPSQRTSSAKTQMRTLLWRVSAVSVSRLCSGTASGLFMRPAALALLLRDAPLRGPGSSQNKFAKDGQRTPRKLLLGPSQKAELRHLGAWPTRSIGAPTKIGRFHQRRHSCTRTK